MIVQDIIFQCFSYEKKIFDTDESSSSFSRRLTEILKFLIAVLFMDHPIDIYRYIYILYWSFCSFIICIVYVFCFNWQRDYFHNMDTLV